jgi:hypothetical protein
MVYLLNAVESDSPRPAPPERRRAVIIGATAAGLSAALHLGEHSLLLERRNTLEDSHDHANDVPLGAARGRAVGLEEIAAGGERSGVSASERKALFISCSFTAGAGEADRKLIHIERWRPPELAPSPLRDEFADLPSGRALIPLLRGELRLGACVIRISPAARLLDLADGRTIHYDKLLSTLSMSTMARLVMHEVPRHVRCDEILRYWLGEHDVELADRATQDYFGDVDDFSAGKRVATQMGHALAMKFGKRSGRTRAHGIRLFEPQLVQKSAAPAMP